MNPGATAERVHEALKARIMGREFRPGERLDPAVLASSLAASVTPVRDALHLLTGEGLVGTRPGGGFHLPALDEPALRDLYDWSADLLLLALRKRGRWSPQIATSSEEDGSIASRASDLFWRLASRSPNFEHARAVGRLNARLYAVRLVEPAVLAGVGEELCELGKAAGEEEGDRLRRLISAYHRRRRRAAAGVLRALYRAD